MLLSSETADGHDVQSSSIRKDSYESHLVRLAPPSSPQPFSPAWQASTPQPARRNSNSRCSAARKLVASGCLPNAAATVSIKPGGPVEVMDVHVDGLPPNTEFDFFVIQKPGAPFGLAWYQGDIETDDNGEGHGRFIGRFNEETFIVAQAPPVPAPAGAQQRVS